MKQIIIDANLMVLLVVGLTNPDLIERHKRTRKVFQKEDLDLLKKVLSGFDQILLTPHILTETSNLVSQIGEPAISQVRITLSKLLQSIEETFDPSVEVVKHQSYVRLGLTDCSILRLMGKSVTLLTADLSLFLDAAKSNPNAINFNYLRQERLMDFTG
ncbi:PIN domain-containing protein [Candidatus Nitronereus thalassa]|uniref:PIN domain-containing protein n=1 Tax=Candidatus Nitronereus thalassa TaxID=3020898 RepID=A0ABU3K5E6_9BACT|nr:PIN domain-containing protein [Candidatus Nitronereus thalassa]MDT7041626.1 PIN domain-containing protein [Candidatus Nitronereus thalassa]